LLYGRCGRLGGRSAFEAADEGALNKRETIRKAVTHLACVFDFAEVEPNPVRDKLRVRLPRGEVREPEPPSAEHVEAVYRLLPSKHRRALLWLDWSGARVSSIDTTTIGD
jgi:hypothetical protein